jgi:hypothetical protein
MTQHSRLGASGSARWIACPGSVALCAGIPSTTSDYAREGTAAHALAERCLRERSNPGAFLGHIIDGYAVTDEMVEAVHLYIGTVLADLATAHHASLLVVEHRFDLSRYGRPDMFGTADAVIIEPFGKIRVYDFKYGQGVAVEALANPQMLYYGLGAESLAPCELVELVIVQPRAHHHDGPVRRCEMPVEDLLAWGRDVLLPAAEATALPGAPLCPGPHCRKTFCPAMAVCPAQRETALALAAEVFAPRPQPLPSPTALTPANLREILVKADLVEAWFAACREHVRAGLENGMVKAEEVGHKLVAGRASRKWQDEAQAEAALVALVGDAAFTKKLVSPAQATKLIKGEALPPITETRGVQLAPLSDTRAAINPASLVFEEVKP